ncbi:monocarboxylate transporter 10-like isoform X1 [Mercenaria mercenaria]|uniref:monocarboxylate transporter 10-like isoform X1 n=2 Tax=Mercenaria mercenaria TaxID=6596 RepID=UPI00234F9B27|nr:monocarboxylate transporter 10-like isoform X1 [Mercenaria mercenaria]
MMVTKTTIKKRLRKIIVVVGSHFAQMLSSGMSFSFGILYREIRLEFGTSQSDAAWAASMFNSLLGFVGLPLGVLTHRTGERWVAVVGAVLLATGMLTSMFATRMSTIYITYGLIAGLGSGIIHYCGNTILGPHFNDKWRPVAMTIANAGVPLSSLILPPVMTVLIEKFDWRKNFMLLACVSLIGIPSGLAFSPPEIDVIEGEEGMMKEPSKLKTSVKKLLKNINFILYFAASFSAYFGLFVPATFLPDLMYEAYRSSTDVYIVVMVLGSTDFLGRLLFGAIAHKLPRFIPFIQSMGFLLFGLGTAVITFARSFLAFIILAAIVGLGSGGFSGLHCVMAAHVVPVNEMRLAYGLVISVGGFPMLAGMPLAGLVTDSFGTQRGAYIFSACLFGFGSFLTCMIGVREICGHSRSYEFEEHELKYRVQSNDKETIQEQGVKTQRFEEN